MAIVDIKKKNWVSNGYWIRHFPASHVVTKASANTVPTKRSLFPPDSIAIVCTILKISEF